MKAVVERVGTEPIILVKFATMNYLQSELHDIHKSVAALLEEIEGPCYRIDDFGSMPISTSHLVTAIYEESQARPGSASDPRIRHIIVGAARILAIGTFTLAQNFTPDNATPVFVTVEKALSYARTNIEQQVTL
jgi:hypothetical protein